MNGYPFYKQLNCDVFYIYYMYGFLKLDTKTSTLGVA